jgi:hypothetical protein
VNDQTPVSYPYSTPIDSGDAVTFEALPAEGFRFVEWTGDVEGETATAKLVMTCEKTVTAVFAPIIYSLTTSVEGDVGGAVQVETSSSAEGFVAGSEVSLRAEADEGYTFSHWSGAASGQGNPAAVVMKADTSVVAHFRVVSTFSWWWVPAVGGAVALPILFIVSRRSSSRAG